MAAAIYTVQNLASLLAYQNLEALTFNVLNQTKILSAALCCYLVMGKKQTKKQSFSLVLLLISALVIEDVVSIKSILAIMGGASAFAMPEKMKFDRHFTHGVVPVLFASLLSGLAGALTQKNLQGVTKSQSPTGVQPNPKNPYLFSMELSVASVLVLLTSLLVSADGKQIIQNGFFHLWTRKTIIPVLTNSFGGILVGLVTKHAGSVRKGFVLIFGILLSGLFQAGSVGVSSAQIIGGILAATSLCLHTS
jgi:UDP-sugar transporter A1/2/3